MTMQEQDEACKIAMLGNDVECAGLGCAAPTAGWPQDAPYYGASYAAPMASMQDASDLGKAEISWVGLHSWLRTRRTHYILAQLRWAGLHARLRARKTHQARAKEKRVMQQKSM